MRSKSRLERAEKVIWLAEPIVLFTLSFLVVGMFAGVAREASDPADRVAAWIVVIIMIPVLYFLWRLEYSRFRRRFPR